METYDQNNLLRTLPPRSVEALAPHLSIIDLPPRACISGPGDQMTNVYFPLTGVVSLTTGLAGSPSEVATIGNEGMVGLPVVFGTHISPFNSFVQIGGTLCRVPAEAFENCMRDDEVLRGHIMRYLQAIYVQIGQAVVCNQRHSLRQRCARWLLMTHDRVPGDEFHLTHEFLAIMLGVRRAGVTVVAGSLQRAGLIRYRRGAITVLDRAGLESESCDCYSVVRDEYKRVMGVDPVNELELEKMSA